jgi:hypothetical protein
MKVTSECNRGIEASAASNPHLHWTSPLPLMTDQCEAGDHQMTSVLSAFQLAILALDSHMPTSD